MDDKTIKFEGLTEEQAASFRPLMEVTSKFVVLLAEDIKAVSGTEVEDAFRRLIDRLPHAEELKKLLLEYQQLVSEFGENNEVKIVISSEGGDALLPRLQ